MYTHMASHNLHRRDACHTCSQTHLFVSSPNDLSEQKSILQVLLTVVCIIVRALQELLMF